MIEAILYPIAGAALIAAGYCGCLIVNDGKVDDLRSERDKLAFELRDTAMLLLCLGQRFAARKAFKALGLEPDGSKPKVAELPAYRDGWPTGGAA